MRRRLPDGAGGSAGKLSALLDAAAGVEYEGEAAPTPCVADRLALKVWNFLATGMGGALSAANVAPHGARFSLRLPVAG